MKKKILLVEYATSTIDTIKEILSHPIFDFTLANEGEQAKKLLAEESFDLMITAAMLPKFHGFSLSQYAAENYPGLKIIITSHIYKGVEYKHQAISQYMANDFFEIPFDKDQFKKRTFDLLDLNENDLVVRADMTTTQIPISDTRKIPTVKKLQEEAEKKDDGLSSDDLFGDIINRVQKEPPPFEIKLEGDAAVDKVADTVAEAPSPGMEKEVPPATQILEQPNFLREPGKSKVKSAPPPSAATQKIDLDLLNLLQSDKKEKKEKEKEKLRKIEDDISRKLEDTLSGLGISARKPPAPKKEPEKPLEARVDTRGETGEISGYEILGQIGRGGMADVYKAKKKGPKGFEKIIALKKILSGYGEDAKYLEMLVYEAKIAVQLSHPNIVQIYDLGQKDDYYFIAMEYVSGKDLRVVLNKLAEKNVTMPEELSIYLVTKVLEALNYAHSARDSSGKRLDIVHRDVSPPNILVSYDGSIKLTDFGVSKASIKMHQTLAGALKGKILYMSPEQASGEDNIDYRSDLYSVGIILFELITGEKLFLGSSEIVTLKKVQQGKIIKPSQVKRDIEPELEAIMLKALEKDPGKRYQKAAAMIKDLDGYRMKHYDSMPESSHIAHFIYTLFKEEITREGIEVNIQAIPHPIKRIKKESKKEREREKETVEITKAEEPIEEDILELEEEEHMPMGEDTTAKAEEAFQEREIEGKQQPVQEQEAQVEEEALAEEEEFQPVIEINFDEDQVQEEAVKEPPGREVEAEAVLPQLDALEHKKDSKKKRNLLLVLLLLIVVVVIVIAVFLIDNLSTGRSDTEPGTQTRPAKALLEKPAADQPTAPAAAAPPPKEGEISTETGKKTGADAGAGAGVDTAAPARDRVSQPKERARPPKADDALLKKPKVRDQRQQEQIDAAVSKKPKEEVKKKPKEPAEPEAPGKDAVKEKEKPQEAGLPQETAEKPAVTAEKPEPVKEQQPKVIEPAAAPPTTIKEGDIVSANAVDTNAEPVSSQDIKIPRTIRRLMLNDERVFVTYLVDHNGNVETVKVIRKSGLKRLNAFIIETVKKWKFKPASKDNVKVKVWKNKWFVIKK